MKHSTTIRASDVASFVFCERAWYLERQGAQPNAQAVVQRASGTAWHRDESQRVAYAGQQARAGGLVATLAFLALLVLLAFYLFTHAGATH